MKLALYALVALIAVAAGANAQQECKVVSGEGNRWKEKCNWCSCFGEGNGRCTRMGCDGFVLRDGDPQCEGNPSWKVDCNWCTCDNGRANCSTDDCTTTVHASSTTSAGRSTDTFDGECVAISEDATFKRDCNTCTCSQDGLARCTRIFCRERVEDTGEADTPDCKGQVRWKDDCNVCECINGFEVCSKKTCIGTSGESWTRALAGKEVCSVAAGRGRYQANHCNWCLCSKGRGLCTKKFCFPGREAPGPHLCEGQITWKLDDCNWCRCVDGKGVCTEKVCGPESETSSPAPPADAEQRCTEEGRTWVEECNTCFCQNGASFCTRRACLSHTFDTGSVDGSSPELDSRAMTLSEMAEGPSDLDSAECQNGSTWRNDCNTCSCAGGVSICTLRACLPGSESDTRFGPLCEEDSVWKDNCNVCSCYKGVPLCTKKGCRPPQIGGVGSLAPSLPTGPQIEQCKEGDTWMKECNSCQCSSGGIAICTAKACISHNTSPIVANVEPSIETRRASVHSIEPMCTEGSRWMQQCNWCTCTEKGVGVCGKRACLNRKAVEELDGTCEGEARWKKDDCNWCNCVNGTGLCTLMFCPPDERSEALLAQESCFSGNKWTDDCNVCFCANGIAVCTKRACLTKDLQPKSRTNSCNEGDVWSEDCNTCRCLHGQGACTKRGCLQSRPQARAESPFEAPPLCAQPAIAPEATLCGGFETKWTYEADKGVCEEIVYGGCGGTENLFSSSNDCSTTCMPPSTPNIAKQLEQPDERCFQPIVVGPCFSIQRRYAYNAESGRCELFHFGGCQGNQNNFESVGECFDVCGGKPPVVELNCDRTKCNWKRFDHYIAKGCEPIYEGGSCCPTSFACTSEEKQGKSPDRCYYKQHEYEDRQMVPVEHDCSTHCMCRKPANPDEKANIVCADIECPSLHRRTPPGCRELYIPGRCCSTEQECTDPSRPPVIEPRSEETCTWGNRTYKLGDKMFFDDFPCQKCICTSEFTTPRGLGCNKIDCGFEFRYRSLMTRGCAPVFFEESCCSIDWMCPEDTRILEVIETHPQLVRAGECALGALTVPLGNSVQMSDCRLKCSCQTPPELTCTQYSTCEGADGSDKNVICPEVTCPASCRFEVDSSTGCPKCFCPSMKFTCPAPSCPPECPETKMELDESTGCVACKCQCRTDPLGLPPCPMDCAIKIIPNKNTGCDECVCDGASLWFHPDE